MEDKILEIALDGSVKHTSYFTLNKEVSERGSCNAKFFEGTTDSTGKRIRPLDQAKQWAKANSYTHVQVTRITKGQDKLHKL